MNEIVNKFLSQGDKLMPEMHLRQPRFTYSACGPLTKNKEYKKLKKDEIQDIFIKTNYIQSAFSMIWFMKILRAYPEEQLRIKYYVIKHLILVKIKNMDINVDLLQRLTIFLIKSRQSVRLHV